MKTENVTIVKENSQELYEMIVQVRICFNRLKALSELILEDLDINPSMRAVLEALNMHDRQTVPEIAQQKDVSRQHIQMIMNALVEGVYVNQLDNPAHKRSPQFELTPKGRDTFANVQMREAATLTKLTKKMNLKNLQTAKLFVKEFNGELSKLIEKGKANAAR